MLNAHAEARNLTVLRDFERIAENGRIAELLHEGRRELREGVAQNDDLREAAELIEKLFCARHRVYGRNGVLNLLKSQAVLLQNIDAVAHQLIVIRLISGGTLELRNARRLRKCNPDLRNQYTFKIQANNIHVPPPKKTVNAAIIANRASLFH